MKNLIHINFNSKKWNDIVNHYLKKDLNICVGYKNNISKLKKQKKIKLISLNNKSLFFHKEINIGQNYFKKNFYLLFFKTIKIFANILIKILKFDNYITYDDASGPLNLILIKLFIINNINI